MSENKSYNKPPHPNTFKAGKIIRKTWGETRETYENIPENHRVWGPYSIKFTYLCEPKVLLYTKITDDSTSIGELIYANEKLVGRWQRYIKAMIPHKFIWFMYVFDPNNPEIADTERATEVAEYLINPHGENSTLRKKRLEFIQGYLGKPYVNELKILGRVLPETGEWLVQSSGQGLSGLKQRKFEYQCERALSLIREYILDDDISLRQVWKDGEKPAKTTIKKGCRKCNEEGMNNFIIKINNKGIRVKKCKSCRYSERLFNIY